VTLIENLRCRNGLEPDERERVKIPGRSGARHWSFVAFAGMWALGFETFLAPHVQSCIITAFAYPSSDAFDFGRFYRELSDRGFIIYPGKLTEVDTFRIGNIGRLFAQDIQQLVLAIGAVCRDMGIFPVGAFAT
jgi:aspartate aminotransferase-like enzyme